MKPTIEIIVSPQGDISIDALGFKGPDCEKATRAMEEALGVVHRRIRKPEYLTTARAVAKQTLGR
jgi:hypothetical protein